MSAARIVSAATRNSGAGTAGLLRHAIMLTNSGRRLMVLCEKAKLESLADDYDAAPVTCPRCLRALRKETRLASGTLAGGGE